MRVSHRGAVLLTVALALAAPPPVAGNNFGSDWQAPCDATDASQCVGYTDYLQELELRSLEANQDAATRYACTYIYRPAPDVDCGVKPSTDLVLVFDGNYGSQWLAWTACSTIAVYKGTAANHTRACKPQYLRYDLSHTTAYDTQTERRKIACHEIGHTYGLRHSTTPGDGTATCMTFVATQATVEDISAHDESHLASYYPH